ncbi:hypothetical protein [Candidatus Viridilinea mediisalina]|uniref:Uncharacterized protein n=1 Tax=Candidatus Viridilinea mediisalina TaxID=2024553 RepID=A0A2A6RHM0_9CHLR|nr:hypothetical protein [Candidatus Viridilinea mediisalina]PDW02512.1 hypothetical protein CJ255_13605 [Candidatus Viridilinea mediisalina]
MKNPQDIRHALVAALPLTTAHYGENPDRRFMYVPPAHTKALRLESNLVVGARGVGKSFWTAALRAEPLRRLLAQTVRDLERTTVHVGFAVTPHIEAFPDSDVFALFMSQGTPPYTLWRAVIARWLATLTTEFVPSESWAATVAWVQHNPEALARLVQHANQQLTAEQRHGLIVFDALDRTSAEWQTMDSIVRELLRVVLWLKSYPRLHAKVFLREDQFDRTVTAFPDASKLLATKTELTWAPHDLHGLLWQMLCNAPDGYGTLLRSIYAAAIGTPPREEDGVWQLAEQAKRDSAKQRALFAALAGSWMGKDRRRGVPYVWSVSHLADGRGRTSPRSFLEAIRAAAEDTTERYPDHTYALHYESIKRGVQSASQIRVSELAEDYPWVKTLMAPLYGLTVPCSFEMIEARWLEHFPQGPGAAACNRLPPQHAELGWAGVRDDVTRLGIFEMMHDGRINMPDLYRVGFGLARRGGVKPLGN